MKNKTVLIMLSSLMCISGMIGCGKEQPAAEGEQAEGVEQAAAEEQIAEATSVVTDEQTPETPQETAEEPTPEPTAESTEAPAEEMVVQEEVAPEGIEAYTDNGARINGNDYVVTCTADSSSEQLTFQLSAVEEETEYIPLDVERFTVEYEGKEGFTITDAVVWNTECGQNVVISYTGSTEDIKDHLRLVGTDDGAVYWSSQIQ